MSAGILELRLFVDSPFIFMAAFVRVLKGTVKYMLLLSLPLLLLTVPMYFAFEYFDSQWGEGLPVGTFVVLQIPMEKEAEVTGPNTLEITKPSLFSESEKLLYLRVKAKKAGLHQVQVQSLRQEFRFGPSPFPLSTVMPWWGTWFIVMGIVIGVSKLRTA